MEFKKNQEKEFLHLFIPYQSLLNLIIKLGIFLSKHNLLQNNGKEFISKEILYIR